MENKDPGKHILVKGKYYSIQDIRKEADKYKTPFMSTSFQLSKQKAIEPLVQKSEAEININTGTVAGNLFKQYNAVKTNNYTSLLDVSESTKGFNRNPTNVVNDKNPFTKEFLYTKDFDKTTGKKPVAKVPEDLIDHTYGDIEKQNYISWGKSQGLLRGVDENLLRSASLDGIKKLLRDEGAEEDGMKIIKWYGKESRLDNSRISEGTEIFKGMREDISKGTEIYNTKNKKNNIYNKEDDIEVNGKKSRFIGNFVENLLNLEKDWNSIAEDIYDPNKYSEDERMAFNYGFHTGRTDKVSSVLEGESKKDMAAGRAMLKKYYDYSKKLQDLTNKEANESFSAYFDNKFTKSAGSFNNYVWDNFIEHDKSKNAGFFGKYVQGSLLNPATWLGGAAWAGGKLVEYGSGIIVGGAKRGKDAIVSGYQAGRSWMSTDYAVKNSGKGLNFATGMSDADAKAKDYYQKWLAPFKMENNKKQLRDYLEDPFANSEEFKNFEKAIKNTKDENASKEIYFNQQASKFGKTDLSQLSKDERQSLEKRWNELKSYQLARDDEFYNLDYNAQLIKDNSGSTANILKAMKDNTPEVFNMGVSRYKRWTENIPSSVYKFAELVEKVERGEELSDIEKATLSSIQRGLQGKHERMEHTWYSIGATTAKSLEFAGEAALWSVGIGAVESGVVRGLEAVAASSRIAKAGNIINSYSKAAVSGKRAERLAEVRQAFSSPTVLPQVRLQQISGALSKNLQKASGFVEKTTTENFMSGSILKAPKYAILSTVAPSTQGFKRENQVEGLSVNRDNSGDVVEIYATKAQHKRAYDYYHNQLVVATDELEDELDKKEQEGIYYKGEERLIELQNKVNEYSRGLSSVTNPDGTVKNGIVDKSVLIAFQENFMEEVFLGGLYDRFISPAMRKRLEKIMTANGTKESRVLNAYKHLGEVVNSNKYGRLFSTIRHNMNFSGETIQSLPAEMFEEVFGSFVNIAATREEYAEGIAQSFSTDFATQIVGSTLLTNLIMGGGRTITSRKAVVNSWKPQTASEFYRRYKSTNMTGDLVNLIDYTDLHNDSELQSYMAAVMTAGTNFGEEDKNIWKAILSGKAKKYKNEVIEGVFGKIEPEVKENMLNLMEKQIFSSQVYRTVSSGSKYNTSVYKRQLEMERDSSESSLKTKENAINALKHLETLERVREENKNKGIIGKQILANEIQKISNNNLKETLTEVYNDKINSNEIQDLFLQTDKNGQTALSFNNTDADAIITTYNKFNNTVQEGFRKKMESEKTPINEKKYQENKEYKDSVDKKLKEYRIEEFEKLSVEEQLMVNNFLENYDNTTLQNLASTKDLINEISNVNSKLEEKTEKLNKIPIPDNNVEEAVQEAVIASENSVEGSFTEDIADISEGRTEEEISETNSIVLDNVIQNENPEVSYGEENFEEGRDNVITNNNNKSVEEEITEEVNIEDLLDDFGNFEEGSEVTPAEEEVTEDEIKPVSEVNINNIPYHGSQRQIEIEFQIWITEQNPGIEESHIMNNVLKVLTQNSELIGDKLIDEVDESTTYIHSTELINEIINKYNKEIEDLRNNIKKMQVGSNISQEDIDRLPPNECN